MSILKSILHHYNKTTKSYDTLHPETESAQITDWNQGIVNTLASTALGTLVSTLTSDSLLATMIQKVLTATGVKYNIAQNGYLCFGSLFGGLIIQWGLAPWVTSYTAQIRFPISFSNTNYILVATGRIEDDSKAIIGGVLYNHKETIGCILRGTEEKGPAAEYIALGT